MINYPKQIKKIAMIKTKLKIKKTLILRNNYLILRLVVQDIIMFKNKLINKLNTLKQKMIKIMTKNKNKIKLI